MAGIECAVELEVSVTGAGVGLAIRPIRADGVGPDHVLDDGPLKVSPGEVSIGEIGAYQVGAFQDGAAQVSSDEIGVLQVGAAQVAVFQIGPGEAGPFEIACGEGRLAPEVHDGLPQHYCIGAAADHLTAGVDLRGHASQNGTTGSQSQAVDYAAAGGHQRVAQSYMRKE